MSYTRFECCNLVMEVRGLIGLGRVTFWRSLDAWLQGMQKPQPRVASTGLSY